MIYADAKRAVTATGRAGLTANDLCGPPTGG